MITVVAGMWIALGAELTPANAGDGVEAGKLMLPGNCNLPSDIRYVLGDQHYNSPMLRGVSMFKAWQLIATHRGSSAEKHLVAEPIGSARIKVVANTFFLLLATAASR